MTTQIRTYAMKASLLSAVIGATFAYPAAAQVSLFERLGISAPSSAISQIMPYSQVSDFDFAALSAPTANADERQQAQITAPFERAIEAPAVQVAQLTPPNAAPSPIAPASVPSNPSAQASTAEPLAPTLVQAAEETPSTAPAADAQAENPWTQILQRYITQDGDLNRFDYAALAASSSDMKALAAYIDDLAGQTPSTMSRNEALAYWANLYNALTVQVVAENWPVKSIKEIKSGRFTAGPWKRDLVTVEGRTMSLDDIEHGTMRKQYDEPRIHYMVNCASIGCPNLKASAWDAETLEQDMDAGARAFVNSPRGASVSGGKLTVSSIYDWFSEDFGDNDAGVIAHLKRYANADLKAQLDGITKVSKDQYDWGVNAQ